MPSSCVWSAHVDRPLVLTVGVLVLVLLGALAPSALAQGGSDARPPAGPQPVLTFEESAVVVSGLTPGGEVQLFAVSREAAGYLARVVRRDERLLADETGTARYEIGGEEPAPVPVHSVWAAIDVSSGAFELSPAPGAGATEIEFPGNGLRRGNGGRWNRVRSQFGGAFVLYVRPGDGLDAGAWGISASDGTAFDADGAQDGRFDAALDLLVPVGVSPPAPLEVAAGDVVVIVDPNTLTFFATRFAG